MDSVEKLTSAITMVEEARGVPLSASCVVHRGEMLELLDEAREALPNDLESAQKLIAARDAIIEEGRVSAEQMIAMAREDVARMVEQTSIVQMARDEARKILDEARTLGDQEKQEVEEYIDGRLATLEVILNKTQDAVARGRERVFERDIFRFGTGTVRTSSYLFCRKAAVAARGKYPPKALILEIGPLTPDLAPSSPPNGHL